MPVFTQLRALLDGNNIPIPDVLAQVDDIVQSGLLPQPELEQLYRDHPHTDLFVQVLHRLAPILPPSSIVTSWFDLVLKPALRDPNLATSHAKHLVLIAINDDRFQSHLFDLYLLDAHHAECWKSNLEYILLHSPNFLTHVHLHFHSPSARLQLFTLLNQYVTTPQFAVQDLASHPLFDAITTSLLIDNSSTVCSIALSLLIKLLPMLAVHAADHLKRVLPALLTILARVLCWKERSVEPTSELETRNTTLVPPLIQRSDLEWERLEQTFGSVSVAPSPWRYFTFLYYLFPCTVLRFLREPIPYLTRTGLPSPYSLPWEAALDEAQIRSRSEVLLRNHLCHHLIVWRDSEAEMQLQDFWTEYDATRIACEAARLDVRSRGADEESLLDLVATSTALKSSNDEQTLHRQVLILRNELDLELWLSKENIKHIGRLYQDKILSKSAEAERQGLYNKLRNYRTEVTRLESELRDSRSQAASTKNQFADWNTELTRKLKELREEKKVWVLEKAGMRDGEEQARALFQAQKILLQDAQREVLELNIEKKENQHKIDRLGDYERQIEQFEGMQRVWDSDFARFNERGEHLEAADGRAKQMEIRLECLENLNAELEGQTRILTRQVQTLEARAVLSKASRSVPHPDAFAGIAEERKKLGDTNRKLREENEVLREEREELRAMLEVLKSKLQ